MKLYIIAYVTFIIFGLQAEVTKKNDLHLIQDKVAQTISLYRKGNDTPYDFAMILSFAYQLIHAFKEKGRSQDMYYR